LDTVQKRRGVVKHKHSSGLAKKKKNMGVKRAGVRVGEKEFQSNKRRDATHIKGGGG